MKRQVSALGLMGLLVVGGFIGIIAFESEPVQASSGSTLYVGGTGGGNYSTIQAAVNAANPGDTVFVFDDNAPYFEHITINKTINLIGEDRNTTIINGSYSDTIIKITSKKINISNPFLKLDVSFQKKHKILYK